MGRPGRAVGRLAGPHPCGARRDRRAPPRACLPNLCVLTSDDPPVTRMGVISDDFWAAVPKVGTNRTATTAHKARRLRILRRDPMCQLGYAGCTGTSIICDHVIPLAAPTPIPIAKGCAGHAPIRRRQRRAITSPVITSNARGRRKGIRRRVRRKRHHPNADDLVMRLSRDHPPDKRCPAASFPGP